MPVRGTLGRELYSLLCDRVGAQALREDVTGHSFRDLCHAPAGGAYGTTVDRTKLDPITEVAKDADGNDVSVARQNANRNVRVARIEALARRREDLIIAFDTTFPSLDVSVKDLANPDPKKTCDAPSAASGVKATRDLRLEMADAMSRLVDLYNDGTIPSFTDALGAMLNGVKADPEVQLALARVDARRGYRPSDIALGVARPALAYPRISDLANVLMRDLATDSQPFNLESKIDPAKRATPSNRKPIPGDASGELQSLLQVLRQELRSVTPDPVAAPLAPVADANAPNRELLGRPRSTLELAKSLLLRSDATFGQGDASYITRRDELRGVAQVTLVDGKVASPFVDIDSDGQADLDDLGRFKTVGDQLVASPFFDPSTPAAALESVRGKDGRAPYYDYIDTNHTVLAEVFKDARPLFEPDKTKGREAMMYLLGGARVLFGDRDADATAFRDYAPDPSSEAAWRAAHTAPPPANLNTTPVRVKYRAFHPESSPIVDLLYALGQIVSDPATDDAMALMRKLVDENPNAVARLVGLGLNLKAIADAHPEAHIPKGSTFWDEMLDVVVHIAQEPGILEDLMKAFTADSTLKLDRVFAAYVENKDVLSYQRDPNDKANYDKFNGAPLNRTTGKVADPLNPMVTKVDRSKPDSGENRSALQRFAQLLHDANGLAACTKPGAVAHIRIKWNGIPINLNYPNDFLVKAVCTFVGGGSPPDPLPMCGILRFDNIAGMLLDVALGRAKFDIRDTCLRNIVNNPTLTSLVGGANAFLEDISGIKGFSLDPTVGGVSRLTFFDAPYTAANFPSGQSYGGDDFYPKTRDFLKDIIDPVPSTVCPLVPFTDTDGKVVPLRKCASFDDTLRGRDEDGLFPLETMEFVQSVRPLAAAFADHNQPLLFVDLFNTLHLHWGSTQQTKKECDPSLPRSDARWCSGDGAVTYEPLLTEVLRSDLFPTLNSFVKLLAATKIPHCDSYDANRTCTHTTDYDGVKVMAEAVRLLVDPKRSAGLVDRKGNAFAVRNDGTKNPQVTPLYLFIDALKSVDSAFDDYAAAHTDDTDRQGKWRAARSQLVDTFLAVNNTGDQARFANPAIAKILPPLLDLTRAQVFAQCKVRDANGKCTWAKDTLAKNLGDVVSGPTFAAVMDLAEAVRKDDAAREELQRFIVYLLDTTSENDAQPTTLAAMTDLLQVLNDDGNLTPLYRMASSALSGANIADDGRVVSRGLADASIAVLSRFFARAYDETGSEICGKEIDPNRLIGIILKQLVTPIAKAPATIAGESPLEVFMGVVADVNRADPSSSDKLTGADYGNISNEVSAFCLDKASGLTQVYEVIREATKAP